VLILGWKSLQQAPYASIASWKELRLKLFDAVIEWLHVRDFKAWLEIRENPLFDYGAAQSVRKSRESRRWQHYFQKADSELYLKTLNRTIYDTIVGFLDDHNIDTSDLKKLRTTIINNGFINNGINNGTMAGTIQAQAFAGGAHGQAKIEQNGPQSKQSAEVDEED